MDPRNALDSSNSGSDITLRLFDRLRAQQQRQKEEKEQQVQKQQAPELDASHSTENLVQNLF